MWLSAAWGRWSQEDTLLSLWKAEPRPKNRMGRNGNVCSLGSALSPRSRDHLEETLDTAFCIGKLLQWTLISRCRTPAVTGESSWESLSVMVANLLAETEGVGLLLFYRGS